MIILFFALTFTITPLLAQCDWNDDGSLDILDLVSVVDCILLDCDNDSECDWNADGVLDVTDVVNTVDCILQECWVIDDVTDFDGNTYQTIVLGEQIWMAENLRVTHYRDGDEIPTGFTESGWNHLDESEMGAYAEYADDTENGELYGYLYNWYAVNDLRELCPEAYHVPTDAEWTQFENFLGINEGGKLKSLGTIENGDGLWYSPNTGATNETGFSALPGGYRYGINSNYLDMGYYGYFWSSTATYSDRAWRRLLNFDHSQVGRHNTSMRNGYSIRCIAD
jgi:uncharacterized protein (TIGR02145 family)